MKIIDLLNKIANGEEVPDAIKWGCHDFKWFVYEYIAKGELGEPTLLDYLSRCPSMINDEIITFYKIEEKKIPEKLEEYDIQGLEVSGYSMSPAEYLLEDGVRENREMINWILDYLKSKGE